MKEHARIAIAVVGLGAILPDAPNVRRFWENVKGGRYSIGEVDPGRWDPAIYYDPDPRAPDKTYCKIGGWVREWDWDPRAWKLPIPPRVADSIDEVQRWGLSCARAALLDYGWPARALDAQRTGVILGVASGGEQQFVTSLRVSFPEFARELERAPSFAGLAPELRATIVEEARAATGHDLPGITEDTMPGELANVIAGRIGSMFNLQGPNYICDAACASGLAAANAAVGELLEGSCDAVLTGGIDHTMNSMAYIKFSKIGALSATGTRPYADGADGFVMGEGAAFFLLKRLEDAERDGDRVYAVIRGFGASSDGRGKGITAPNPAGQRLAVERAWKAAGLPLASVSMIEGHGTSTRVGDRVEVEAMSEVLREAGARPGSIALGSVKSNIGHLKAAAGAAGLLKTVLALDEKVLPPSIHFDRPNPDIDFAHSPLRVNTELRDWELPQVGVRRAGVSAFGFGGTNFHGVLEEYVPGRLEPDGQTTFAIAQASSTNGRDGSREAPTPGPPAVGAGDGYQALGRLFAQFVERRAPDLLTGRAEAPAAAGLDPASAVSPAPTPLAAAPPVPPAPARPPAAVAPVAGEDAAERILGMVAEKTGYPQDMLDPDLDLEADLGVDTVKQAELFAAVREAYGIPRDESVKLRDFPTLRHVIDFVRERAPASAAAAAAVPVAPAAEPAPESGEAVAERILGMVAEKTGYPQDMLDLDLDLEADLGVDTVKQAELFAAVREAYGIPRDESVKLRDFPTLRHVIDFVRERAGQG